MNELYSVVLTGFGAITASGPLTSTGAAPSLTGQTAPATLTIENFKLEHYLASQKTYLDRCSALALGSSALALRDAGLEWPVAAHHYAASAFGLVIGTHLGCIETMKVFWDKTLERGISHANPLLFSHSYFNTPASLCAIEFGLQGYHTTCCAGHESGIAAVRVAYDAIRRGHVRAMLAGGVEALTPTRALCEPVPTDAPGLGEAGVCFILEEAGQAAQRGASTMIPLDDAFFEAAATQRAAVRVRYGDCGGAESALCLALSLLK